MMIAVAAVVDFVAVDSDTVGGVAIAFADLVLNSQWRRMKSIACLARSTAIASS